jgi:hypothetical protein
MESAALRQKRLLVQSEDPKCDVLKERIRDPHHYLALSVTQDTATVSALPPSLSFSIV